jgi:hypothetical protein
MQLLGQSPVQLLRQLVARFRAWKAERKPQTPFVTPLFPHTGAPYSSGIHREVTSNGVRVYSLCSDCGSQLNASATLCEECAQKRSRPARPY